MLFEQILIKLLGAVKKLRQKFFQKIDSRGGGLTRTLTIRSKDGFPFSVTVLTYTKDGSNSTHVLKHGSRKKSSFDRDLRSNFFLTSVSSIGFLSFDRELRSASRPSIVFYDRSLLLRSRSSIDFSSFDRQVFLRSTTSFFLLNQGESQRNRFRDHECWPKSCFDDKRGTFKAKTKSF